MKFVIKRLVMSDEYTIGQIWINGVYICDTVEDTVRELPEKCNFTSKWQPCRHEEKVYGKTAIPAGIYKSRVSYSPKFTPKLKTNLVEIMNVPHFLGIRIHSGNTAKDSEGCVIVGTHVSLGRLKDSRIALDKLHKVIKENLKDNIFDIAGGEFEIEVINTKTLTVR